MGLTCYEYPDVDEIHTHRFWINSQNIVECHQILYNNCEDGIQEYYLPNGTLTDRISYKKGKMDGLHINYYFKTISLYKDGNFIENLPYVE